MFEKGVSGAESVLEGRSWEEGKGGASPRQTDDRMSGGASVWELGNAQLPFPFPLAGTALRGASPDPVTRDCQCKYFEKH